MSLKNSITNPYEENYNTFKRITKNAIDKRSESLLKDKTFCEEYKALYFASLPLSLILSITSAVSSFFALNAILSPIIGGGVSVVCVAICLLIEYAKKESGGIALKYKEKYKKVNMLASSLYALTCFLSLSLSVYGAYRMANLVAFDDNIASYEEINTTNIKNAYESKIFAVSDDINALRVQIESTKSNSTKRDLNKSLLKLIESKDLLTEKMHNEIRAANNTNKETLESYTKAQDKRRKEHINKMKFNAWAFSVTAAILEIILFLCNWFLFYYYYRNEVDRTEGFGVMENQCVTDSEMRQPSESKEDSPNVALAVTESMTERNKIGFKIGEQESVYKGVKIECNEELTNDKVPNGICANESCSKTFERKTVLKLYCSGKCKTETYRRNKRSKA